jgi:hypothetical protein
MPVVSLPRDYVAELFHTLPGYEEGMTWVGFITGRPGRTYVYDMSIRTFHIKFATDAEAVMFKLAYVDMEKFAFYYEF